MAEVWWETGALINIGDYSNVHYTFGCRDAIRDGETKEAAQKRIIDFVEDTLEAQIQASKDELTESVREMTALAKNAR